MRGIKFRAWDKEEKKMLYTGFCIIPTSPSWSGTEYFVPKIMEIQEWFDCSVFDWADGKMMLGNYELMQYTGLKDKNGKEAYHKDIMKDDVLGELWFIEWSDEYACFELQRITENTIKVKGIVETISACRIIDLGIIIGNIYEHKELLD